MLLGDKFYYLASLCVLLTYVLSLSVDAFQFRSRRMMRKMRHRRIPSHRNPRCANRGSCSFGTPDVPRGTTDSRYEILRDDPTIPLRDDLLKGSSQGNVTGGHSGRRRSRRAVFAWPPDAIFIAQYSIEIPLYEPNGLQIPYLLEVPYEIDLPNVTETIITGGARLLNSRTTILGTIESLLARFGFGGKSCVLRAVCERAEADSVSQGLIGEIFNLILRVSATEEDSPLLDAYKQAEYNGRTFGSCSCLYSQCPISFFHFFD